ncbi:WhiB family transcriptional regulator [Streptomyces sp. NPDC002520]
MTVADLSADWQERAACAGKDTNLWFSTNPTRAQEICGGCHVRPECLYDALQTETPHTAYGVRGGLTRTDRKSLPALPSDKADAIAMLRELLPLPEDDTAPDEGNDQPMSGTQTASTPAEMKPPASATDPEKLPVGKLLKWGAEHPEPEVQDQAARVGAALAGLRKRYAADQELAAITTEAEQLEQRLAELRSRRQELAPAKSKKRRATPSYEAAPVRAWARANNIPCPPVGRVPKTVVEAWGAAHENKEIPDA